MRQGYYTNVLETNAKRGNEMKTEVETIREQIEELQLWFARKPYGFRDHATPEQLQQWTDREREESNLIDRLERLTGK